MISRPFAFSSNSPSDITGVRNPISLLIPASIISTSPNTFASFASDFIRTKKRCVIFSFGARVSFSGFQKMVTTFPICRAASTMSPATALAVGSLPGSASIEHGCSEHISFHAYGIEYVIYHIQRIFFADQCRCYHSTVGLSHLLADCQQFDGTAHLLCICEIFGRHLCNAFGINIVEIHLIAAGKEKSESQSYGMHPILPRLLPDEAPHSLLPVPLSVHHHNSVLLWTSWSAYSW